MRVVIADDEVLLRQGVARLLNDAGFDVVGTAGDARALEQLTEANDPDVVIVDIRMPPSYTDEGLVAARRLRAAHPGTGVLVLSHYLESVYAMRLLEDHPERVGYLLKERVSDIAVLADGLRRIAEGECVLDPTIVSRLLRRPREESALQELTEREREVLALMAEGLSNAAIAGRLFLSEGAISKYTTTIFAKLDLAADDDINRRVRAVLTYLDATTPAA